MGALRLTSITDCRSRNCEESATTLQNKVTSEVAKFFRRYITLVSDRKQEPSEPQTIRFEIFSWQRQKINFRHHIRVGGSKASIKKTPFLLEQHLLLFLVPESEVAFTLEFAVRLRCASISPARFHLTMVTQTSNPFIPVYEKHMVRLILENG